ncbi:AAA family ATPase [Methanoplanus endosymbiosus]|uniref:AAA family ATPase n=1 Tax=Methanoplanus endosymbiosus TaxID=33865 RepID=A0A9E7THT6_9EURY|nr:AAA family ATPase [Methanoplanus endosymbiosus]UUX91138.1 AAA family ATPase [Methanoplanus endosymbiosus]
MIKCVKFENFTAFQELEIGLSPGINVFTGENSTGKTHILKTVYAGCEISKSRKGFAEKLTKVFLPSGEHTGRLVKRSPGSSNGFVEIQRVLNQNKNAVIRLSISNHTKSPEGAKISGAYKTWSEEPIESVYIPVKDMMANAPGFRSLYSLRDIHFEEVYADIIDRAFLGSLKGPMDAGRKKLMNILQKAIDGRVVIKNEEFFLKNKHGELEFTLVAEGLRKLVLLWLLIQNGTLTSGSVLCWDEPEANLNPRLMRTVVEILVELQRMGVQILISTHDYIILKEFDLQRIENDKIIYHSLFRDKETNEISISSTLEYEKISPNAIDDTFADIIDRDIAREMRGSLK